ncbi:aminodeoxychorismate lyase [Motilimonas pumila]|uniref:Aminodeoxychorismate lyase n=1 Tax=Motilimonas pumila TaxID=2303987 RepID=A0A418YCK1_9GAMM|nr:aminodeoxychorismate lyase [Motilimonas pumila]RJG42257.1 aminodeoxychorismate lyase [Motilimonas pumila]
MMLINGKAATDLPISDRATQYGDGFFTTAKIVEGEVQFWRDHVERLMLTSKALHIELPSVLDLFQEVQQLVQQHPDGVLKIMISRGQGGRGYSPAGCSKATRVLSISELPSHYTQWQQTGIELAVCEQKIASSPMLAGLKTLNRLEQVLLKREVELTGKEDGLVLAQDNTVVEATAANIFWYHQGTWYTPDLRQAGIKGIMRKQVLAACERANMPCQQGQYPLTDVLAADAVFICNSLMGLVPVKQCQQQSWTDFTAIQRLQKEMDYA